MTVITQSAPAQPEPPRHPFQRGEANYVDVTVPAPNLIFLTLEQRFRGEKHDTMFLEMNYETALAVAELLVNAVTLGAARNTAPEGPCRHTA